MDESCMASYLEGWKKTFIYKGRTTRRAFWSFILGNMAIILLIAAIVFFFMVTLVTDRSSRGGMMLVWAWYVILPLQGLAPVILLLPFISLGIRRMHDAGRSGWWFGGALLGNLLVLPLLLTGLDKLIMAQVGGSRGAQMMDLISTIISTVALIYLIWLCCLPSRTDNLPGNIDTLSSKN